MFLILFSYYFFLNNNCLNFTKLVKSYIDLGYSNIKPCYIGSAKTSYDEAYKQLSTGNDNLVLQATKLEKLGVKNKKELSEALETDASLYNLTE